MSETFVCAHCGSTVPKDEMSLVDGAPWCEECTNEDAYYCEHCRELTAYPTEVTDSHGNLPVIWCEQCADEYAVECDDCGELFASALVETNTVIDADGDSEERALCPDCRTRYYSICEDCGCYVRDEDIVVTDDGCYCPACAEEHVALEDYGHTYAAIFKTSGSADPYPTLFMGIELETESNRRFEMANALRESRFGYLLECKKDGSLTDGCEIVTQPCTPDYHLNSGMWALITQICLDHDATSHDNGHCGLHIHVSKSFFGGCDSAYECAYLIDTWLNASRGEFTAFSRRSNYQLSEWARFSDVNYPKGFNHAQKLVHYTADKGESRYLAINTTNYETIEFRLWRGTLNIKTLRATIELTAGLCILARALRARDEIAEGMPWNRLRSLVLTSLHLAGLPTSDLLAYLEKKGL